ncbi:hypothetical protein E1B28_011407 [Marasmius oreades]|uniref:Uncharacterized protein n=1 Tax=Marasmius oreades TaxID=181124 RepID=A0A9P7RUM3_9AGAR|nr:uncharacterized protein E1B28_011407 [Marasmius oreades]KAG7089753.1 hypothetical protein E1B28_011407 [Marasmius oreades]
MTSQAEVHKHPRSLRSMSSNSSIKSTSQTSKTFRARAITLTGRVASVDTVGAEPMSSSAAGNSDQEKSGGYSSDRHQTRSLEDRVRTREAEGGNQVHQRLMSSDVDIAQGETKSSFATRENNYQPPPSAFNRVPLSHLDTSGTTNVRDSVLTQSSLLSQPTVTSSSIYPQSTSSASTSSRPDSMISELEPNKNDGGPVIDGYQEFKGDDVSYRLRLLVNNNYFLPPAHAKPKPSDFSTGQAPIPKKPPTPTNTFLDFFRKPKSKPTTPTGSEHPIPILRSTSDSTAASAYGSSQPRTPFHPPHSPGLPSDGSGRVVVVREKMEDLVTAAKQAEQEMKERAIRQDPAGPIDTVIDPTDSVDVPLPGSGYPFAVQASTVHGLGVEESVGAAVLADRLPPQSPDNSFQTDDDWRKALLKAAVGHSFENIEKLTSPNTSMPSPTASGTTSPTSGYKIGLKIISSPILLESTNGASSSSSSPNPQSSASPKTPLTPSVPPTPLRSIPGSIHELPERVETPSTPLRPLQPPPRRQIINPIYSLSQTDLPASLSRPSREIRPPSSLSLRKTTSSPMLPNVHESHLRPGMTMTPPPLPMHRAHIDGSTKSLSNTTGSIYSTDDGHSSRASTSTSGSQNSQRVDHTPSPTTSTFLDALSRPPSQRASSRSRLGEVENNRVREDHAASSSRLTSSQGHRPPSSFQSRQYIPHKSYSDDGHVIRGRDWRISISSAQTAPLPEIEIFAPEPTTPPLPLTDRREAHPLRVSIPPNVPPPSIHSAPAPASFFDSIQSELSSLEDLDSSSDESEDDSSHGNVNHGPFEPPRRPFVDHPLPSRSTTPQPRVSGSRTPIMRLGNHSSPHVHVSRSAEERREVLDSRNAVGHTVPSQYTFFTDRVPLTTTFELYQYAGRANASDINLNRPSGVRSPPRRPATMEERVNAKLVQNRKREQESLKRLDGLLIQHMRDEKDMIRRITTNSRVNHTLSQSP